VAANIEVEVVQMDLSEPEKCMEITKGLKVDILINNGGISQRE
jgi:short-subunit dehydrogenase